MPKNKNLLRRLLDRIQARFARSRPGSVLVLVVALLVLMALIGTAFITTARTDRFSAQQNAFNTEIDLLVQGVVNMAEAAMTTTAHEQAGGQHWDDTRSNHWVASRIPGYFTDACGAYVSTHVYSAGDYVLEPFTSGGSVYMSLVDNNTTAPSMGTGWVNVGTAANLSTTPAWSAVSAPLAANSFIEDLTTGNQFQALAPGHAGIVAQPNVVTFAGKTYPALSFIDSTTGLPHTILAASASGDGVADSFLWRLPIGEINGVTYYAATRIIDNNAAINLNTALSSTFDFDQSGNASTSLSAVSLTPGIFTGNIGLAEMTKTFNSAATSYQTLGTEIVALSKYRSNIPQGNPLILPDGLAGSATFPTDELTGAARNDFQFNTLQEALYMGLGRRVNHPGIFSKTALYQALTLGDAQAMAYRFELANPNSSPAVSEILLATSLYNTTGNTTQPNYRFSPYPATTPYISTWLATFQDQAVGMPYSAQPAAFCLRPFVTTHNPLNNMMPAHPLDVTRLPPNYQAVMGIYDTSTNTAPRVSLDTADVLASDSLPANPFKRPSLWLGFYNAMYDGTTIDPKNPAQLQYQQFRSSLRDLNGVGPAASTFFTPVQQVLLRSLIASINARDLRDSDDDVSSRTVQFLATVKGAANTSVNLTVFGTERQPYITEIYANNDVSMQKAFLPDVNGDDTQTPNPNAQKQNPKGYVAVELHNPYPVPISLTGWQLGILTRSTTAGAPGGPTAYPGMTMLGISGFTTGFAAGVTIPANGYAVLENFQATPAANPPPAGGGPSNDAQYRPFINYAGYTVPANAVYIYVPNLHEVFSDPASTKQGGQPGGELYLLRPRSASGALLQGENSLGNLVPADSFDFSGTLVIPAPAGTVFQDMHYVRANGNLPAGPPSPTNNNLWRFVYPGRWTPNAAGPRQEGTFLSPTWDITAMKPLPHTDPWIIMPPGGGAGPGVLPPSDGTAGPGGAPINLGNPDPAPSYINKFPAVQLNNTDFGGPNKLYAGRVNRFPYGGFARLGDILQVPFIGGYTVTDNAGNIIEMNAVTMDSAFADDNDGGANDSVEQLGRFCPLVAADPLHTVVNPSTPGWVDTYGWAAHIMDYFSVLANPNDDYLPNADPNPTYDPNPSNYAVYNPATLSYQLALPLVPVPTNPPTMVSVAKPAPVPNLPKQTAATANRGTEDAAPIEGLINVNTASFSILRRVPFIPGASNGAANDALAQQIIAYRNVNGPFRTLFDLNNVPGFQNAYGGDPKSTPSSYDSGDLSTVGPSSPQNDGIVNDFERRFMEMTRVSNLLTTRSDTYTAYILVQGWRGIGTATPELVVQRRAAFIADRSGLTATNKSLNVVNVQAN